MSRQISAAYIPLVVFFYAVEYSILRGPFPRLAEWLGVALAIFLNGAYLYSKKRLPAETALASQDTVFAASIVVLFHSVFWVLLPPIAQPALSILFLLALAWLPTSSASPELGVSRLLGGIVFIFVVMYGLLQILQNLLTPEPFWLWSAYGLMATGALFVLHIRAHESNPLKKQDLAPILLGLAHLQAALSLYKLVTPYGSLAVSSAWAIYASSVLLIGFVRRDRVFAQSSLLVLLLAAGKALLYDLSSASAGVRILCLLLTGALLYGSGFLFRKIERWEK
jgi:hypothetical protein